MDQNDLTKFRELYFTSAKEHLDKLEEILERYSRDPRKSEDLSEFRLHSHSLKGESLAMGIDNLGSVAKVLERIAKAAAENHVMLGTSLIDEMKKTVSKMKESLSLMQTQNKHLGFSDEIMKLKQLSGVTVID